ncbi:Hypothetical predicted protein [Pelobates cultripes]|uniref:DUF4817 domain-containing protein n=1 Tax=Pelobates cultripes TaxID=61616 RepID=A0AAD1WX59_PELCU|nr:Hypothetical predicted protein [Pelobates cultripes]
MVWTGVHRGFAVRAYLENNQSVIAMQRAFRRRFNIPSHNAIPNFPLYKMMFAQELSVADNANHRNLCDQMLAQIPPGEAFFSSDEAHFHLSGAVNKQNFRYWAQNNPQIIHERPLHSPKLTVWCAVSMMENFLQPRMEEIVEEGGVLVLTGCSNIALTPYQS